MMIIRLVGDGDHYCTVSYGSRFAENKTLSHGGKQPNPQHAWQPAGL